MKVRGSAEPPAPAPKRRPDAPPERVRLFVALELSSAAREELVRWRRAAVRDAGALRLIAPEYLHATLCFLGWRAADETAAILDACSAVRHSGTFELRLGRALWLPRRRPRVLAVELEDDSGKLAEVQAALSGALAAGRWYVPEKRPYLAHVTVARVSSGVRPPDGPLPAPPALGFAPSRVTLYRSRLGSGGARYEALGGVELAGEPG